MDNSNHDNSASAPTPVPTWMPNSDPTPSPTPASTEQTTSYSPQPAPSTWSPAPAAPSPAPPTSPSPAPPPPPSWSTTQDTHEPNPIANSPLGVFVAPPMPQTDNSKPDSPSSLSSLPAVAPSVPVPSFSSPPPINPPTNEPSSSGWNPAPTPPTPPVPIDSNPNMPDLGSSAPTQPASPTTFEPPPTIPDFLNPPSTPVVPSGAQPTQPDPIPASTPAGLDLSNLSGGTPSSPIPADPTPIPSPQEIPAEAIPPADKAPEDLSQVSQNSVPVAPVFNLPVTDGSTPVPTAPTGVPENLNPHSKGGSSMKKWIIIGSLVIVVAVAGVATYFLLMTKSSPNPDTISLPATQAPLTNPPKQVKPSGVATPSGSQSGSTATSSGQSAFDQLKNKQVATASSTPR
jgi:hypothetical protein